MRCPACQRASLHKTRTEDAPLRLTCSHCGGHWVNADEYWKWLEAHGPNLPERRPQEAESLPVEDSARAMICAECGHILTRCRVGGEIRFHLDRCATCGGMWFDRNEWEVLRERNLHDDAHFVFSAAWQHALGEEERRQAYLRRIISILGHEDFEKVCEFKKWALAHPERGTIEGYFSSDDVQASPVSVSRLHRDIRDRG